MSTFNNPLIPLYEQDVDRTKAPQKPSELAPVSGSPASFQAGVWFQSAASGSLVWGIGMLLEKSPLCKLTVGLTEGRRTTEMSNAGRKTMSKKSSKAKSKRPPGVVLQPVVRAQKSVTLDRVIAAIDSEPVLDGPMPDDLWARCATRQGAEMMYRAVVMATKKGIKKRCLSL